MLAEEHRRKIHDQQDAGRPQNDDINEQPGNLVADNNTGSFHG
jgi:hypothetical protein